MKNKCIIFLFCHSILLLAACTGGFENDNEIKGGFSDDKKEIDFQNLTAPFEPIQSGIYFNIGSVGLNWVWQMTQSLNHDMFSGYFMDPIPKFMKSNACYNLNSGWTNAVWQCTYGYVYTEVQKAEKNFYGNDNLKGYLGITEILKVELMHRIADTYGPLVYHQLGETPRVYGLQEAYTRFFADLDEGQQLIREYLDEGGDNNKFKEYDMLTNGKTLKEWLKFANSLRLRLAMRISNVDATLAKDQATKALNDNQGVLEGARETIAVMGKNYNQTGCAVAGWGVFHHSADLCGAVRFQRHFRPPLPVHGNKQFGPLHIRRLQIDGRGLHSRSGRNLKPQRLPGRQRVHLHDALQGNIPVPGLSHGALESGSVRQHGRSGGGVHLKIADGRPHVRLAAGNALHRGAVAHKAAFFPATLVFHAHAARFRHQGRP